MSYRDDPAGEQGYGSWETFGPPPSYDGQPGYGQPGYGQPGYGQPGPMPPTYRAWGIAAFICGALFNLILGGTAAYMARRYSDSVPPLWANGNVQAAVRASRRARGWLIASFVFDALGLILVLVIFHGASSNFNNPSVVAASMKTQIQKQLSDSSGQYYDPGVTVTSVVCTRAGAGTDHCVIKFSTGQNQTQTATISGNGSSYSAS